MEVSKHPIPGSEDQPEQFAAALHHQSKRTKEFLSAQKERLRKAEQDLSEQLRLIAAELADDRREIHQSREDAAKRETQLQKQSEDLEQLKTELSARKNEWEGLYREVIERQQAYSEQVERQQNELTHRQQELAQQEIAVASVETQLKREKKENEASRAELDKLRLQLQSDKDDFQKRKSELDSREQELKTLAANTENKRRIIARELKAQKIVQLKEIELQRASLDQLAKADNSELLRELHKLQADNLNLKESLANSSNEADLSEFNRLKAEKEEIAAKSKELDKQANQLKAEQNSLRERQLDIEKQRQEIVALETETNGKRRSIAKELKAQHAANLKELEIRRLESKQASKSDNSELLLQIKFLEEENRKIKDNPPIAANDADRKEIERLTAENESMASRFEDLEKDMADAMKQLAYAKENNAQGKVDEDLINQYELALVDIRELKAQNEELQQQIATARQSSSEGGARRQSGNILNWEDEKQRILAVLESDMEENSEEEQAEKIKIKDVVLKTDSVLEEKNREISELKHLLESQTGHLGSMAVGAAALGQILDSDAVVQEERNNLTRLQEECRDKLSQAEVEISLERAKIARERMQLEDRLRALENQTGTPKNTSDEHDPSKPSRGRWLARLGLSDSEKK